jgi:hypothetical protein
VEQVTGTASQRLQVTGGAYFDGSGRIGIGTTNPQSQLHINFDGTAFRVSRGSATGFIYNTGTTTTSPFRIQSDTGGIDLYSFSQPITFTQNGSEVARIESLGQLGIGTNSPTKLLHLSQNSDVAIRIHSGNCNTNARSWEIVVGGNASNNAEMVFRTGK